MSRFQIKHSLPAPLELPRLQGTDVDGICGGVFFRPWYSGSAPIEGDNVNFENYSNITVF